MSENEIDNIGEDDQEQDLRCIASKNKGTIEMVKI